MSAAHRYVDVRNTTASKERLMVMLFEAALRHMRTAARHLENKDRKAAAPLLEKACQIVLELQSTLKPELAPKLAENLIEIYTFTAAKVCRANITGDVRDLRQAERAFAPIVDGFAQAVAAMGANGAPVTVGPNPTVGGAAAVAAAKPVVVGPKPAMAVKPTMAATPSAGPGPAGRAIPAAPVAGAASTVVTANAGSASASPGMKSGIAGRYTRLTR